MERSVVGVLIAADAKMYFILFRIRYISEESKWSNVLYIYNIRRVAAGWYGGSIYIPVEIAVGSRVLGSKVVFCSVDGSDGVLTSAVVGSDGVFTAGVVTSVMKYINPLILHYKHRCTNYI